jgi:M6 family metalloprotease-like protein
MKKLQKKALFVLSGLSFLCLAACNNTVTLEKKRVELTVENASIPAGGDFFDSCKPMAMYIDENSAFSSNYYDYKNQIKYVITNKDDNSKTYGAGDALPAGNYTASATVKSKTGTCDFTVTDATPDTARDGLGYRSLTAAEQTTFDAAKIGNHKQLGALGKGKFPTVGTPHLIVVPVTFMTQSTGGVADNYTSDQIEEIRKAFFGEASETGWQSLKSFYKSASYGKLDIQGEVSPQYVFNGTKKDFASYKNSDGLSTTWGLADDIGKWFKDTLHKDMSDYDYDGDGYIDGMEMIYNATDDSSYGGLYWNYTAVTGLNAGTKSAPNAYRYFWSAYDKITSGYLNPDVDAHTLIHETGHLMGLNDYYCTDKDSTGSSTEGAAGCVDMMDMNVGDHNAYSKMAFDWVDPLIVDGSSSNFEVTLDSYTDTGKFLLVRDHKTDAWNGLPYDEYLLLEYYTPTGVNTGDSQGYKEWRNSSTGSWMGHGGTYAKAGLQVFHIDTRLYHTFYKAGVKHYEYTDALNDAATTVGGVEYGISYPSTSNSPSRSVDVAGSDKQGYEKDGSKFREVSAILSSGVNGLASSTYYDLMGVQSNLFTTAAYGGASSTYSNFRVRDFFANDLEFNDGTVFPWTISVTGQTDSQITLHFVENA